MPRRKQNVKNMEKYEVRATPSLSKLSLGPMLNDWDSQRSAAGFEPSSQQQWIKHLLEVHSLACNGEGCAKMYEDTQVKSKGRPKGSTSPRNSSSPRPRGRPRKGSPHRNTTMYDVQMNQADDDEEEEKDEINEQRIEEEKKDSTSDSESTSGSTSGENGHTEVKQPRVSLAQSLENEGHGLNQDTTGLEEINQGVVLQDPEPADQGDSQESTVTFEQVEEKTTPDPVKLEQQSNMFFPRLHDLYPQDDLNNPMPLDLTTGYLGYTFPNIHTPPSSPSTTTSSSSNQSTLPPTAEYKEVRLRRGNGYYIREYIYIKNRDCNGKIFLRCQFRASCRARAVVLVDTGKVIVTQSRHTHPPPHPQMIRFGPHIKDISATWVNRVAKKEREQAKLLDQQQKKHLILSRQLNKVKVQAVRKPATIKQTMPIRSIASSSVVHIPTTSTVPIQYKFAPQLISTQGNNISATNSVINVQQPLLDNGSKVNSGMPLILKSWSLLKGAQPNIITQSAQPNLITQPLNVIQQGGKTYLLQSSPTNATAPQLINVVSQPQVSLAYNFNPGAIISQPITTLAQNSNIMQRVIINPNLDQNTSNLSLLKDNQFILGPGMAGDALNSATITVQPQPTSPLPVQPVATLQHIAPVNGIHFDQQLNGTEDTITIEPQPTSPLPVQLIAAMPQSENGAALMEQIDQNAALLAAAAENGANLDLSVVPKPESGKKRANLGSIMDKLMMKKQQRLSTDQ